MFGGFLPGFECIGGLDVAGGRKSIAELRSPVFVTTEFASCLAKAQGLIEDKRDDGGSWARSQLVVVIEFSILPPATCIRLSKSR